MKRRDAAFIAFVIGLILAPCSVLLEWVHTQVGPFDFVSQRGLDLDYPAWGPPIAVTIAAIWSTVRLHRRRRHAPLLAFVHLLLGCILAVDAFFVYQTIESQRLELFGLDPALFSAEVGVGVYVLAAAGLALILRGLIALTSRRR